MFGAFESALREIDSRISSASAEEVPILLENLPSDVFGCLHLDPPTWLPNLREFLARMPPEQVQIDWTGSSGRPLLQQSVTYYRSLRAHVATLTGVDWKHATVADYGCGWGRLTRLFGQHTPAGSIYALDPWDQSIELCREHGVKAHLLQCDYVPTALPVNDVRFDVVSCFSVFTHLSEKCHRSVLSVLRRYVREDGILALTIRPPEYWDIHQNYPSGLTADSMKTTHRDRGFAFIPHNRTPIGGDITYGDASVSLEYCRAEWIDWEVAAVDLSMFDPYQVVVFLRPR